MARHTNHGLRKICGCARRKWATCPHGWHFSYKPRRGRTHYRFSLDKHFGKHIGTKTDAGLAAAELRALIDAGKFGRETPRAAMTLAQLIEVYDERYVKVHRAATADQFRWQLDAIAATVVPRPTGGSATFGSWPLADIVTDTVERFREVRRQQTGVVGVNRLLGILRALYNWAVRVGYVDRTPFKRNGEVVVKLEDESARTRRLQAGEGEKILAHASPSLHALITAAIETGMRRGELLSLQWMQVEGLTVEDDGTMTWAPRAVIFLPAAKTKTRKDRRIPVSQRLKAVLEMRRLDPAGGPLPTDAHVFGTEIGTRVDGFRRAWATAVLRGHGHQPRYTAVGQLDAASRTKLNGIDLHFHDLRREAGSRWLEGGVPLHTVRDWLGHTSIAQTSTYLSSTIDTAHDAMARFDAGRTNLPLATSAAKPAGLEQPSPVQGRVN
jgi:integrase